ncbi:MAG: transporter substrate-binding domain-containing protein [Lachnospiraceae bacterium]|nr:transporter substrate-binding domain-containing protein [Lachnospiraceae bacterium]
MKKRILTLSMCMVLAVGSLAACTGSQSEGQSSPAPEKKEEVITAKVIDINLTEEQYAFGVDKDQPELLSKTNEYIAKIMSDGTFEEICSHYFGDGTPVPVTSAELDGSKDQLLVATNAAFEPFEYMDGENYVGVDMEIAKGLADYLGQELVIQNMDFDSVCLSIGQHKSDIAMSGLTIKPEREEYVTFTDPYYEASQKLIVRSDNHEFDNCSDAAAVEAIFNSKGESARVGVQTGTTGQFYCEGDEEWGFAGFKMTCTGYKNGSLAVQDLLNKNLDYVVIDSAPADAITKAINAMQ